MKSKCELLKPYFEALRAKLDKNSQNKLFIYTSNKTHEQDLYPKINLKNFYRRNLLNFYSLIFRNILN